MEFTGAALFLAVFGFLAVGAWSGARASERKAQARYALLTKVSEQPTESARLVLEYLREEREKDERRKAHKARQGGLQTGAILLAVGVSLSAFLFVNTSSGDGPAHGVWLLGGMLVLMGLVFFGFAFFSRQGRTDSEDR